MAKDDRRWLVPEIAGDTADVWIGFNAWLVAGGLGIIYQWASDYVAQHGAVLAGVEAPMTATKLEIIEDSQSEGQRMLADLVVAALAGKLTSAESAGKKVGRPNRPRRAALAGGYARSVAQREKRWRELGNSAPRAETGWHAGHRQQNSQGPAQPLFLERRRAVVEQMLASNHETRFARPQTAHVAQGCRVRWRPFSGKLFRLTQSGVQGAIYSRKLGTEMDKKWGAGCSLLPDFIPLTLNYYTHPLSPSDLTGAY